LRGFPFGPLLRSNIREPMAMPWVDLDCEFFLAFVHDHAVGGCCIGIIFLFSLSLPW
jgi:hypothetical protein